MARSKYYTGRADLRMFLRREEFCSRYAPPARKCGIEIGTLATRKPPWEREIEIDRKFYARRWVICVSRARRYTHTHTHTYIQKFPGTEILPGLGSRRGRRWKTHLNFFLGPHIFSIQIEVARVTGNGNDTPSRCYNNERSQSHDSHRMMRCRGGIR